MQSEAERNSRQQVVYLYCEWVQKAKSPTIMQLRLFLYVVQVVTFLMAEVAPKNTSLIETKNTDSLMQSKLKSLFMINAMTEDTPTSSDTPQTHRRHRRNNPMQCFPTLGKKCKTFKYNGIEKRFCFLYKKISGCYALGN